MEALIAHIRKDTAKVANAYTSKIIAASPRTDEEAGKLVDLAPKMAVCIALVLRDYAAQIEMINRSLRDLTLRIANDPSGLVAGNYRDLVFQGDSLRRLDRMGKEVEF